MHKKFRTFIYLHLSAIKVECSCLLFAIRMKAGEAGIPYFTDHVHKGLLETFASSKVENKVAASFQENSCASVKSKYLSEILKSGHIIH